MSSNLLISGDYRLTCKPGKNRVRINTLFERQEAPIHGLSHCLHNGFQLGDIDMGNVIFLPKPAGVFNDASINLHTRSKGQRTRVALHTAPSLLRDSPHASNWVVCR